MLVIIAICMSTKLPHASSDSGSLTEFEAHSPDLTNISLSLSDTFDQTSVNSTKDLYLEFFDAKNNTLIKNVSFFINATKDGKVLMNDLFYTKTGSMTIKFSPGSDIGKWTVNGSHDPTLGGWMSENDTLPIMVPAFTEKGTYHIHFAVLALVYVNGLVDPSNPPTFDSWWSVDEKGNISKYDNSTTMSSALPIGIKNESPLKQFKSGISASDVKCANDLALVIKSEDGSPSCINGSSMDRLVRQGWWAWNGKVGDTVVNTPDKRDFDNKTCGMTDTMSSIVGTNGFVKDDLPKDGIIYPGINFTAPVGHAIQFSIEPNSDGYITLTYDFNQYPGDSCKVTTKDVIMATNPGNPDVSISELIGSPDILKVDQNSVDVGSQPLGNSGDITLSLESAEDLNDHVVKVTYKISTKPNAQVGKSYYIEFWWHSSVVITVGDSLYTGTAFAGPHYG